MIKKKAVLIFTLAISLFFSVGYAYLTVTLQSKNQHFYGVQVGAFSVTDNANQLIGKLNQLGKTTYTYSKDNLIYVLTCVSLDEGDVEIEMKDLQEKQISCAKRSYQYSSKDSLENLSCEQLINYLQNDY